MFRKITSLFLVFLLLATTTGYSISKHYCGDSFVKTSIIVEAESCCGDQETSDCCHNENEYFQMEEDFVIPFIIEELPTVDLDILFPIIFEYFQSTQVEIESEFFNFAESPPPPLLTSELSFLQTFLI